MISIPENDTPRDFECRVDEAIQFVLDDPNFQKTGRTKCLVTNHANADPKCHEKHVPEEVGTAVIEQFKQKGYYCRKHVSIQGITYNWVISKTYTDDGRPA